MCLRMALFLIWEVWVLLNFYLLSKNNSFQSNALLKMHPTPRSRAGFSLDIQK